MLISVGNATKGIQKLSIILKLPIYPENNNNIVEDEDRYEWSDDGYAPVLWLPDLIFMTYHSYRKTCCLINQLLFQANIKHIS